MGAVDHSRPFVDRPVEDLAAATAAARTAASEWGLPDPVFVRRGMNAIFRCGEVVLRVGRPSARPALAHELADVLCRSGIRVPQPVDGAARSIGGHGVTAWERIEETGGSIDWHEVGRLVAAVHAIDPSELPPGLPVPSPAGFPWWDFANLLEATAPAIDGAALSGLTAVVERHRGWSEFDETVVCHGDVHPGNVMTSVDGPVLVDWDLVCRAPWWWDHAPLMTWTERWEGAAGIYDAFAAGYGRSGRGDPAAEGVAELRLVAATLLRIRAMLSDPDEPETVAEVERRLRYWRGDAGAPAWQAR